MFELAVAMKNKRAGLPLVGSLPHRARLSRPCAREARARRVAPDARVWTDCARRDPEDVGNPAQIQSENLVTQSDIPATDEMTGAVPNATTSFSLEQYYKERLDNVRRQLPVAAEQLRAAGVARVDIYYDGCGDSGQIEDVRYVDAQRKMIDRPCTLTMSEDALGELFYDLLETRHAGWENNDGAYGDFEWDLLADTLKHSHSERYVECETTEHEGL